MSENLCKGVHGIWQPSCMRLANGKPDINECHPSLADILAGKFCGCKVHLEWPC